MAWEIGLDESALAIADFNPSFVLIFITIEAHDVEREGKGARVKQIRIGLG